jgi:hypothetical protein
MGQIYCGALVIVTLLGFGVARGQLWARDIRFFTIAMVLRLLYALGSYTPAFYLMYELPGRVAVSQAGRCHLRAVRLAVGDCRLSRPPQPERYDACRQRVAARHRGCAGVPLVGTAIGLALLVGTFDGAFYPIAWG